MSEILSIEVGRGEDRTTKIVRVMRRNANLDIVEASVRDARTPVEVVASRSSDGEWEPLYGLKDGERVALPHCFRFNEAALAALGAAAA